MPTRDLARTAERRLRLGEILLRAGLLSQEQLRDGLAHQRAQKSGRLGASLISLGFMTEEALLEALARQLELTRIDLDGQTIPAEIFDIIPGEKAREFLVMPVGRVNRYGSSSLLVAMTDPTNFTVIDDLQFMAGCRVEPALASEGAILAAIDRHYGPRLEASEVPAPLEEVPHDAGTLAPPPAEQLDIEEKFQRLLKNLLDKGILSLRDVERLK